MKKLVCCLALCALLLAGCANATEPSPTPTATPAATPSQSPDSAFQTAPELKVYLVDSGDIATMNLEEYLKGVVAGEMKNDWPLEALKAQAIIARTFAVRFLMEHDSSKYEGADISTDTAEAQAYNADNVNQAVSSAVEQTRGKIITSDGEPAYTWFHSHSGGVTADAVEGLNYDEGNPDYIVSVPSDESEEAPDDVKSWVAYFTFDEIIAAADQIGYPVSDPSNFAIAEKGNSGRATVFTIDQASVPAAAFRNAIGPEIMRSTLIDSIDVGDGVVIISGRGYGHGVGMSQWGAYEMAKNGATAEEIINYYYKNVEITALWP